MDSWIVTTPPSALGCGIGGGVAQLVDVVLDRIDGRLDAVGEFGDDIEVDRRDDARLQRCTGLELALLSRPVVVVGACGEPTDSHDDCRRQLRTGS
jgi:hypothetical protein